MQSTLIRPFVHQTNNMTLQLGIRAEHNLGLLGPHNGVHQSAHLGWETVVNVPKHMPRATWPGVCHKHLAAYGSNIWGFQCLGCIWTDLRFKMIFQGGDNGFASKLKTTKDCKIN